MRARVGDRLVVAPNRVDGPVRDGEIIEVEQEDGSPPYRVRWRDGHVGLVLPGPDAVTRHPEQPAASATEPEVPSATFQAPPPGGQPGHVKSWHVEISVFEEGDDTNAVAVLTSDAPDHLTGRGASRRNPADKPVPEIGDEVAVARALRRLADSLLGTAAHDIEDATGADVTLTR
jgi:hypothetical protein